VTETIDIERIVREVLQRLRTAATSPSEPPARSAATSKGPVVSLTLSDRVITLSAIEGRLDGVRQLAVRRQAIVTPAVRDELKRRGVAMVRQDERAASLAQVKLLAALHGLGDSARGVRATVSQTTAGVEWLECQATTSLAGTVHELTGHIERRQTPGLLLTTQPLVAAVMANRNPAIRAAAVGDVTMLEEAIDALGANLVTVDPVRVSPFALKTIVQRLAAATPVCPTELTASMGGR
jgi:hypothetical protein